MVDKNFNIRENVTKILEEINSLKLGEFSILFTWKNGRKCKAYLLMVFVVANPYLFPSEIALGQSCRLSDYIL